jgi:hypothetical protein
MNEILSYFISFVNQIDKRLVKYHHLSENEVIEAIRNTEKSLKCILSPELKEFIKHFNGIRITNVTLYGLPLSGTPRINRKFDIVIQNTYVNEERTGWQTNWFLLGSDGFGNYFVADTNYKYENGEYSILWLDGITLETLEDRPIYTNSYFSLAKKIIDEMI